LYYIVDSILKMLIPPSDSEYKAHNRIANKHTDEYIPAPRRSG
jgi:hypothetical protein